MFIYRLLRSRRSHAYSPRTNGLFSNCHLLKSSWHKVLLGSSLIRDRDPADARLPFNFVHQAVPSSLRSLGPLFKAGVDTVTDLIYGQGGRSAAVKSSPAHSSGQCNIGSVSASECERRGGFTYDGALQLSCGLILFSMLPTLFRNPPVAARG